MSEQIINVSVSLISAFKPKLHTEDMPKRYRYSDRFTELFLPTMAAVPKDNPVEVVLGNSTSRLIPTSMCLPLIEISGYLTI